MNDGTDPLQALLGGLANEEGGAPVDFRAMMERMILEQMRNKQYEDLLYLMNHDAKLANVGDIFKEQNPAMLEQGDDWDPKTATLTITGEDVSVIIKSLLFTRGEIMYLRAEKGGEMNQNATIINQVAEQVKSGAMPATPLDVDIPEA